MPRVYLTKNVRQAVDERLRFVFEAYSTVVVSVSGGKDSSCLFDLAWKVARELGREIHAFFLDQEAEYAATIDVVREIMTRPGVVPHWYQVPIRMTNATSYEDEWLYAWGPGEQWMRDKDPLAIHSIDTEYPERFYAFLDWFERQWDDTTAFLVGLRAEESLNRYRVMIRNPGIPGVLWCTRGHTLKFYPLYDWSFDDIFHYFWREKVPYNRIYDFMHAKDPSEQIRKMRVSNLIHEKAYKSLALLQEFEHDTYEALSRRLKGVHTAAIYADEAQVYSSLVLPDAFASWKAYRDHLLATAPVQHRERFLNRFAKQAGTEKVYRQQVRQLLLNDWENNIPVDQTEKPDWREKWKQLL